VIVHFDDIGGFVDHHCLNLLFISQPKKCFVISICIIGAVVAVIVW